MTPEQFKLYKKDEFATALRTKCEGEGITLQVVTGNNLMRLGLDPNTNTAYILNNEAYTIHNDGNRMQWSFVGRVA
jgi:hypothetical protein